MTDSLMSEAEVARRVAALAARIAPVIDDECVLVCLLTGAMWFAADLSRALSRLGRDPLFDCLWLSSYGDAQHGAAVIERCGVQRPLEGRRALLLDEVMESGASLACARAICLREGAADVRTAVFARKPWAAPRAIDPDFVAWEAPCGFLVGFGMDHAGRSRGRPGIGALETRPSTADGRREV